MLLLLAAIMAVSSPPSAATAPRDPCRADAVSLPADPASNAEMTALYDADQADRANAAKIDWNVVGPRDRSRRARTAALIAAGRLKTGDDFLHAAFVYQHGDSPEDILTAHALAIAATARGRPRASWIAAASLDRYLQRIGRPQIYGTQFVKPGTKWTQEPYHRELISDALREASCVPAMAAQREQLEMFEREVP